MTIAVVNKNTGGKAEVGPERAKLPSIPNSVTWITGDTASGEIDCEGFRGVGFFGLNTTLMAGVSAIEVHVSNKSGGVFAKLDISALILGATTLAFGTSFIAEWNVMKFVLIGTLTGPGGDMPYCLS